MVENFDIESLNPSTLDDDGNFLFMNHLDSLVLAVFSFAFVCVPFS